MLASENLNACTKQARFGYVVLYTNITLIKLIFHDFDKLTDLHSNSMDIVYLTNKSIRPQVSTFVWQWAWNQYKQTSCDRLIDIVQIFGNFELMLCPWLYTWYEHWNKSVDSFGDGLKNFRFSLRDTRQKQNIYHEWLHSFDTPTIPAMPTRIIINFTFKRWILHS